MNKYSACAEGEENSLQQPPQLYGDENDDNNNNNNNINQNENGNENEILVPSAASRAAGDRLRHRKGDYNLVSAEEANEEADDEGEEGQEESSSALLLIRDSQDRSLPSTLSQILHTQLLPDDRFSIGSVLLVDGEFAVKFLKLLFFTFASIATMFVFVRKVGWEHDPNMKLADMYLYESNLVILDTMTFFVVGRLFSKRGVDHLAWILVAILANIYASAVTGLNFMQHSLTLYEMHCRWPYKLWVFVALLIPLVIAIILLHVHEAVKSRVFVMKLIELILAVVFFLLPPLTSTYFHFHHWFAGWLIGMHCNFDIWWSRAVMAWCWGLYINGIAAYGRDPLLTCGYTYWLSTDLRCPYTQCYLEALQLPRNQTDIKPMIPPNWRNCSADSYHP